ncbi:MAG: response regulator transcription factor [Eggerthellaceae bacterium]|nr:response regulator transcription factor [Eggerthellaceae bacterium]
MAQRIFMIEDDSALREELAHLLELAGFMPIGITERFEEAPQKALEANVDCVVVDLKLPNTDGHAICRAIREKSDVPIIVLTSSESEFDEVMAMNLGADDYIVKPYRPAVLLAHIQALLRRKAPGASILMSHKGVQLDLGAGVVSFDEKSAELTRNEQRILQILMKNPGTVVPRSEIMCALWESDSFIDDNTLTVNVNRLRKTLSSLGVPDEFLVTRRGLGYSV